MIFYFHFLLVLVVAALWEVRPISIIRDDEMNIYCTSQVSLDLIY